MGFLTKSCIAILTLGIAAAYAEATPALGDHSVFNVTLSNSTQTLTGKLTFDLTAYDKSTETWEQTSTTEFNGQKQSQINKVVTSDLLTDATIDNVLANCAARGGVSETVTAPAGVFPACAIPTSSAKGTGKIWVAKVPFGYCKWTIVRPDGVRIDAILESFANGKP